MNKLISLYALCFFTGASLFCAQQTTPEGHPRTIVKTASSGQSESKQAQDRFSRAENVLEDQYRLLFVKAVFHTLGFADNETLSSLGKPAVAAWDLFYWQGGELVVRANSENYIATFCTGLKTLSQDIFAMNEKTTANFALALSQFDAEKLEVAFKNYEDDLAIYENLYAWLTDGQKKLEDATVQEFNELHAIVYAAKGAVDDHLLKNIKVTQLYLLLDKLQTKKDQAKRDFTPGEIFIQKIGVTGEHDQNKNKRQFTLLRDAHAWLVKYDSEYAAQVKFNSRVKIKSFLLRTGVAIVITGVIVAVIIKLARR